MCSNYSIDGKTHTLQTHIRCHSLAVAPMAMLCVMSHICPRQLCICNGTTTPTYGEWALLDGGAPSEHYKRKYYPGRSWTLAGPAR